MRFFTRKSNPYDIAARTALKQFETTFQRDRRLAGRAASPDKPMKPYAGKIDVTRGLNKNMFKFFPVVSARQLQAWCIGDEDELYSLLSPEAGFVTHIGPRKRSGLGEVVDFKIEPDEAAHDLWSRRVLPWPHEGAVSMRLAARPPYWAAENEAMNYIHPSLFT
jgi:CRISPR type IV-associated protein Csf3